MSDFMTAAAERIDSWSLTQLQIVYTEARQLRLFKDPVYQDIAKYINPDYEDTSWYLLSDPQMAGHRPNTGAYRYDTQAEQSSVKCAEGIMGYCFRRDAPWYRVEFEDEDENGRNSDYLDLANKHTFKQFGRSSFYDETRRMIRTLLDFGTAVLQKQENPATGRPTYRELHLARSYLLENEWGEVDVLFRDYWLSPQSAVDYFGYRNLPAMIQRAWDLNQVRRWKFIEYIFPRNAFNLSVSSTRPFADVVVAELDKVWHPVRVSGFDSKPFWVPRYARSPDGGPWGVSAPGMLQLSNVRQLQGLVKQRDRLAERIGDPPLKATEGLYGLIKRDPGDATYLPPGNDYQLERAEGQLRDFDLTIAAKQTDIKAAYHEDFFLVLMNNIEKITESTATGVRGIQSEQAALLSAFFGGLQYEFTEPVVIDMLRTEISAGRLPPPPRSAQGKPLKVTMTSPMYMLMRQALELDQVKNAMVEIGQLGQLQIALGQPPDVLDNFDLSADARRIAKTYNMPHDVVRDMSQVQKIRQGRAVAAQQAAAAQMQETASRIQLNRAKATAAANPNTGNAPFIGSGAPESQSRQDVGASPGVPVGGA
jgi:hypothetical protein